MNEELDSQLSAMFDDELPSAECELLARRLSRDEPLKARWGRYAAIGAAVRAERGVRLNARLAGRVSAVLSTEPALAGTAMAQRSGPFAKWWQPVVGAAVAAGVATAAVLWLRSQVLPEPGPLITQAGAPATAAAPSAATAEPDSYVVPPTPARRVGGP